MAGAEQVGAYIQANDGSYDLKEETTKRATRISIYKTNLILGEMVEQRMNELDEMT